MRNRLTTIVRARTAVAAGLAACLGTLAFATPASAAPAFNGCGWSPANNTRAAGTYRKDAVNIRTGADTSCQIITSGYVGDSLVVRCGWFNSGDGHWWDYVTDNDRGVTGWSRDDLVIWVGAAKGC